MEARTAESLAYKYLYSYSVIGVVYLGMVVGPGVWWPGYYVVVGSVVFGLILFFSFRSHVQAAFALRGVRPATCVRHGSEQACFGFRDSDFGFGGSAAPRVSLVIPSFNEEAVLRQTIPSVLALDYPAEAIEFLYIYESASTDRTAHVIEAFARKDARIRPIRRETTKGGKAPITNDGIRQAAGEIIGIFDADHVLNPDLVRQAAEPVSTIA